MPTSPVARSARRARIAIASALAAAALLLAHPPAAATAAAGTFTVHSCQTPSGTFTGMRGWMSSGSVAAMDFDSGETRSCGALHTASLSFRGPVASGGWISWDFAAPPGTSIGSYEIERGFRLGWPVVARVANRPYVLQFWHDANVNTGLVDFRAPLQAGDTVEQELPTEVEGTGVAWGALHLSLRCWGLVGSLDCGEYPAEVAMSRATIGLTDVRAPTVASTTGPLTTTIPLRGTATLGFHANDLGGGVYRVALAVDGDEVARQVVDDAGGACADVEPGNGDAYEFGSPQPCPLDADGEVALDTSTLADGRHTLHVTVEDAAGNSAVVHHAEIVTHNAPVGTAPPALSGEAAVGEQLEAGDGQWDGAPTAYDHRWLRCDASGDACTPIAGASGPTYVLAAADAYRRVRVEVTAENANGAAVARSAPSTVVADADGRTVPGPADGDPSPDPGPGAGGIQGLANPLAALPGHVANGDAASGRARLEIAFQRPDGSTARRVSTRAGRRWTIVGRVTDGSGAPIAGARLGAAWKVEGRRWVARPGVRSGADGRFVYVLPPGPSRAVRFAYFAFSDSRRPQLSNVVRQDVRAGLTIRADRRAVTGDRVVALAGRVAGTAIPRRGLLVTLHGWQRGWGWRAFRTVRTDRHGRWRTRYAFRLASGRFGFRAVVPRQGTFPYASSRSRGVYVVVS